MRLPARPTRLVLATHNPGKSREMAILAGEFGVPQVRTAVDAGVSEPEETAPTFEGNAEAKARHAADASGWPAIADDTGLCVDALDGRPGVHTKRWAESKGGWSAAREALARELDLYDDPRRRAAASFVCVAALAWPGGACVLHRATTFGALRWPAFCDGPGFVPIFEVEAPPFVRQGVYAHRRAAVEALWTRFDAISGR